MPSLSPRGGKFPKRVRELRLPLICARLCPPPGRQRFRRSEIPTCHPERHGTHNKSDILLVSSTFADPGYPRGGKFPKRVRSWFSPRGGKFPNLSVS